MQDSLSQVDQLVLFIVDTQIDLVLWKYALTGML